MCHCFNSFSTLLLVLSHIPKFHHSHYSSSLHWLKITQRTGLYTIQSSVNTLQVFIPSLWPNGSRLGRNRLWTCEFDSCQCRIYIPCSLSLRLLGRVPSGFSGYILILLWLDTKIVFKKISTTQFPPFLILSPYNQLVLPAHLQLSLSNALPIPLASPFLTDLSTLKWNALPHHLRSHSHSLKLILTIFFSISNADENSPFLH